MTKIEWVKNEDGSRGRTWNPVIGCSKVSPGCANCYALRMAARMATNPKAPDYHGVAEFTENGPRWLSVKCLPHKLDEPLRRRKPTTYFVDSMSDLFHPDVPFQFIAAVFGVMAATPWHTHQILTKRIERALEFFEWLPGDYQDRKATLHELVKRQMGYYHPYRPAVNLTRWPLPNVWLGVSAENQKTADERRPHLEALARAGWLTWVSYEPALGPVDWTGWEFLRWLVSGGESGPGARPSHPDWHRGARDFCQVAGVPYFFKQWGEWVPSQQGAKTWLAKRSAAISLDSYFEHFPIEIDPCVLTDRGTKTVYRVGKKASGRLLDGRVWDEMPGETP